MMMNIFVFVFWGAWILLLLCWRATRCDGEWEKDKQIRSMTVVPVVDAGKVDNLHKIYKQKDLSRHPVF
jgi:hypothetical protein